MSQTAASPERRTAQQPLARDVTRRGLGEAALAAAAEVSTFFFGQLAASALSEEAFAILRAEAPFADVPEHSLCRGLTYLQAAEFLYETSLFPDLEYTFKHALTHEVAYASLLQDRRRALHARIVEALETLYPDRLAEQAQEHLSTATAMYGEMGMTYWLEKLEKGEHTRMTAGP